MAGHIHCQESVLWSSYRNLCLISLKVIYTIWLDNRMPELIPILKPILYVLANACYNYNQWSKLWH